MLRTTFAYQNSGWAATINKLLSFGANVNYEVEGFNCLYNAVLTYNLELVELLLGAGANPNCISTDTHESLLDCVRFDKSYEEGEGRFDNVSKLEKIIQILIAHGAKQSIS